MIEARHGDDETTFSLIDLRIVAGLASGKTQAEIGGELHLEQPAISKLLRACEARIEVRILRVNARRARKSGIAYKAESGRRAGYNLARRARIKTAQAEVVNIVLLECHTEEGVPIDAVVQGQP